MSTPTEPTTPQPKPADAAVLRWHNPGNIKSPGEPPWRFLLDGESPEADDQMSDGELWFPIKRRLEQPGCFTFRTKRLLPTPHAETVGTGGLGFKEYLAPVLEFVRKLPTNQTASDEQCGAVACATEILEHWPSLATTPATQSALEQAREALGHLQWCSSCCQESWENCEGGRQALQALAALNAVLPPAKGGAQG